MCTHASIKVKLSNHFFHFLLRRTSQRGRVEIVKLVKSEQLMKILEGLVTYSVDYLIGLLDFVDNVVTDFRVFSKNTLKNDIVVRYLTNERKIVGVKLT